MNTDKLYTINDILLNSIYFVDKIELDLLINKIVCINNSVTLGFLNQHGYNLAVSSVEINRLFLGIDFLLRDGVGIEWACKLNNIDPKLNMNGTDFIPILLEQVIKQWKNVDCFSLGTQEPWLTKGSEILFKDYKIHTLDGFKPDDDYLDFVINNSRPGKKLLIVLAMGMPKQERVAHLLKQHLKRPALIICGGAILDFSAGRFSRCPDIFRRLRLEWCYRLALEPRRLFRRYVIGIPLFLFFVVKNRYFGSGGIC